jgi:hypothetical protein
LKFIRPFSVKIFRRIGFFANQKRGAIKVKKGMTDKRNKYKLQFFVPKKAGFNPFFNLAGLFYPDKN